LAAGIGSRVAGFGDAGEASSGRLRRVFRSPRDLVALLLSVVLAAGLLEWQWGLVSYLFGRAGGDDVSFVTVIDDPEPEAESTPTGDGQEQQGSQEIRSGLYVDITPAGAGGDGHRSWLQVDVWLNNTGTADQPYPELRLHCAQAAEDGVERDGTREETVPAGSSSGGRRDLLVPVDAAGEQLRKCRAPAYVEAAIPDALRGRSAVRRTLLSWELDELNSELALGPSRPYAWANRDVLSGSYTVTFLRGLSAAEVLRTLGRVRKEIGSLDLAQSWEAASDFIDSDTGEMPPVVTIAERDGGVVVLSNLTLRAVDRVRALSRRGVAANYISSDTVDETIVVARRGRVVRNFDPLIDFTYDDSSPLREEKGLDFEHDTSPAAWQLLERLTSISVTRDWLYAPHPTYVLTGR
jgi:hypothetical protein